MEHSQEWLVQALVRELVQMRLGRELGRVLVWALVPMRLMRKLRWRKPRSRHRRRLCHFLGPFGSVLGAS
jgi:hypothetical protein